LTLKQALSQQAQACAALESPFMEQLLSCLARSWPEHSLLGRTCTNWPGDLGPDGISIPLRLAGGLHALVLAGQDRDLAGVYPPHAVDDVVLTRGVLAALGRHEAFLLDWIKSAPQTNEVRRSGILIPAAHWIAARHPLPFTLSELGASAGLNLMWDRFGLATDAGSLGPTDPVLTLTPDWTGPLPTTSKITVAERRGVDLNPLDATDPDHVLRLQSYLWPDQPYRRDLTRAAITANTVSPDRGDAIDWLETRLETPRPGHLHLIYHTIAWQYFPKDRQEHGTTLIEAAGARATESTPVAWLRMEGDGKPDGAALTLRLWPGDLHIALARVDYHGRWVRWQAPNI